MNPLHKNDTEGSIPAQGQTGGARDLTGGCSEDEIIQEFGICEMFVLHPDKIEMWVCHACEIIVKLCDKTKHLHSQRHIDEMF